MRNITIAIILFLILLGCSNDNVDDAGQKEVEEISKSSTETQTVATTIEDDNEAQIEDIPEPIDHEKAVEEWNAEIKDWYTASSMGAIDVSPVNDYTHLHVTMHDNFQSLDEEGRIFVVDDITEDLQDLVKEIFEYAGEIQVDFEFQDGSSLVPE